MGGASCLWHHSTGHLAASVLAKTGQYFDSFLRNEVRGLGPDLIAKARDAPIRRGLHQFM